MSPPSDGIWLAPIRDETRPEFRSTTTNASRDIDFISLHSQAKEPSNNRARAPTEDIRRVAGSSSRPRSPTPEITDAPVLVQVGAQVYGFAGLPRPSYDRRPP